MTDDAYLRFLGRERRMGWEGRHDDPQGVVIIITTPSWHMDGIGLGL